MEKSTNQTVDSYISDRSDEEQVVLRKIRHIISEAVPKQAKEVMSYQMPAFRLHRVFIYYAAFKDHYSLFIPPSDVFTTYKDELSRYKIHKATIQFQKSEPMPYELIGKLAKAAAQEDEQRAKEKRSNGY